jgi:hypothetical protein
MGRADVTGDERYWIAINGPTCAIASFPLRNPMVTPTPEQMLGFPTLEEAERAQRISTQAPMDEVRRFFASLAPDVHAGRIRVIQPKHPQPHPKPSEPTVWTEDSDAHEVVQQAFIKTTSN